MSSYVDSSQLEISTQLPDVGQSWGALGLKSGDLRKIFAESSYDTPYGVTNHTIHVQYKHPWMYVTISLIQDNTCSSVTTSPEDTAR